MTYVLRIVPFEILCAGYCTRAAGKLFIFTGGNIYRDKGDAGDKKEYPVHPLHPCKILF